MDGGRRDKRGVQAALVTAVLHWKEKGKMRRITETGTFDSWQVDAGVLVNPDAVANDSQGAFLERARARDQLERWKSTTLFNTFDFLH